MRVINHLEAGGRDAAKGHFARAGKGGAGDFYRCSDRTAGWTEGLNERLDRESLGAGGGAADRRDGDLLARLGARGDGGRDRVVCERLTPVMVTVLLTLPAPGLKLVSWGATRKIWLLL